MRGLQAARYCATIQAVLRVRGDANGVGGAFRPSASFLNSVPAVRFCPGAFFLPNTPSSAFLGGDGGQRRIPYDGWWGAAATACAPPKTGRAKHPGERSFARRCRASLSNECTRSTSTRAASRTSATARSRCTKGPCAPNNSSSSDQPHTRTANSEINVFRDETCLSECW